MKSTNNLLFFASLPAFAGAIIQAAIGFVPEWSAALGAGDEPTSNPPLLLALGLLMALVFAGCGLYGLSGAGLIRRLPLLRLGLFVIGLVCTLNGVPLIFQLPDVLGVRPAPQPIPFSFLISSLVFLTVGLGYLIGLATGWKRLGGQASQTAVREASRRGTDNKDFSIRIRPKQIDSISCLGLFCFATRARLPFSLPSLRVAV